jgi:PTH1 family peptidyl-tRNA hydrolase
MNYYNILPNEICILTDDLDVPFGKVRLRAKGGAGTHNGMKSVIQQVGTQAFMRLRLGIGPKPDGMDSKDFVLQNFTAREQDVLPGMLTKISAQLIDHLNESVDAMMNRLNPLTYFENDTHTGDSKGA